MVDAYPKKRKKGDENKVFAWAQDQLRLHYQWLVLNVYLPQICEPAIVNQILETGAPLYRSFHENCGAHDTLFPMPIEFSAAAFRMGHSMVRAEYDWNVQFGRADDPLKDRAPFDDMFRFTGNGRPPLAPEGDTSSGTLPDIWGADWDRLIHPVSEFQDRSTRRIDTQLAPPLERMLNETPPPALKPNLPARNLRRGVRMNIPSAQACIAALKQEHNIQITPLTTEQLTGGKTGDAVRAGQFEYYTPLWFYVLKEAETLNRGQRLGPLGSHLVAGTIAGLILQDQNSFWNRKGSVNGRWHPIDGARPSGQIVDSLPAFFRAAELL